MSVFHLKVNGLDRQTLPSIQSLRCFEMAARSSSFKAAAQNLHLTPSAISHQIAGLEALLGTALFDRTGKTVVLTGQGEALKAKLTPLLHRLETVLDEVNGTAGSSTVRLTVAPLFFSRILSGRLPEFRAKWPGIKIAIHSVADNAPFEMFDCAIRFGLGNWPGCTAHKLMDATIVAVAAPSLLRNRIDTSNEAIGELPLIDTRSSPGSWAQWLAASNVSGSPHPATTVASMTDAIAAAKDGLGVSLAIKELVEQELTIGLLADAFTTAKPVKAAYWLIQAKQQRPTPALKTVVRWLQTELSLR